MNAGLMFSLCAGILIGLKLFVAMKDRQKAKQKSQINETIEFFRRKAETDQRKASLEMQEFLARQMLGLEKVKRFSKERRYSSVTTNNDNVWQPTHDVDKALKYANEAVRKERLREFCRELWYGTSIKNGTDAKEMTNDGFEDLLKDPTTLFYETNDPIEGYKVMVQSRGKKFIFAPEAKIQNEPRDLYSNAFTFMGNERFDLRDGYVMQYNGKPYICHNGRLEELANDGKFEELEVYTNP